MFKDSINYYLSETGKDQVHNAEIRMFFSQRALLLSEKIKNDSLLIQSNIKLATLYSEKGKHDLFIKHSHYGLRRAKEINDSLSIAHISKNLGYFYYGASIDSAYYYNDKADKLFNYLDDKYNRSIVLLDIALLQKQEKDLTGSEQTSINGLSLLDQLEENEDVLKYKSFFYNNLAHVFKLLEQFDESIEYYKKSLESAEILEDEVYINNQKNNLAVAHKDAGNYDIAIKLLDEILAKTDLSERRPDFYAIILDNYGHSLFLANRYQKLPRLYLKALRICDSIKNEANTIIINQHLAQWYIKEKNKDSAKFYAYQSKEISERYSPDDLLRSLALLSKIEEDSLAVNFYNDYIKLNDSLIKNERAVRNKFARIRYETSKIEQENIKIARERMWLLIISAVLIMASVLLYIVITQRNKNKELKFIQQQQETNEEIYNLMLTQQDNIEEARVLEKKRISEELHDGVLGRLFGTRLSLDSLNMGTTKEAILTRSQYISELKTIEEDIRKVSHELNTDFVAGSGFADIITGLVESQTLAYQLKYDLTIGEAINWDNISNKDKIHMYRILQEALHNIYKHANASKVEISFKLKKSVICLEINDDGSGFDVAKAKSGIGLKNMNSRIKEINGIINIESQIEQGTTVTIEVPIE